jgi:hypothetical protein
MNSLLLWLLRRFAYVRRLERTIDVLTAQLMERRITERQEQEAAAVPKARAFKLKLGWHQIAEREAAKRNRKEQRIQRVAKELETQ